MESDLTLSEKMNIKEEVRVVRALLSADELDLFQLLTLKNALRVADPSGRSKEVKRLVSEIEKRIRKGRS